MFCFFSKDVINEQNLCRVSHRRFIDKNKCNGRRCVKLDHSHFKLYQTYIKYILYIIPPGPCAAGVVAHKVLRYSIFGESVKIASRMSRYSEGKDVSIP